MTDRMIEAARTELHTDVDPSGWVTDDEIRSALRAALEAAEHICTDRIENLQWGTADASRCLGCAADVILSAMEGEA